ncbi:MAG TPA: outer membrane beta-barrel protein, partial [Polyangia bacterium]
PPPPIYYGSPGAMPPHVYIRERIRWHLRRLLPRVIVVPPPPPVLYGYQYAPPPVAPLPPIPPPVVVPPPCCYGAPAVEAAPQEVILVKPRPQVPMWSSRIGLGVRGTGQVINDGWNNLGIGGEFLYRVSPHLSTELAAEYQRSTGSESHLDRVDIPVTLGLRVHIGRPTWVVSPYFVFAAGVGYASQDLKFTTDDAVYVDGQIGGGLELRLGQHFAVTADARLDAKKRANGVADNVLATTSIDGKPVHALGDEVGGQFRLGVAAYF